MSIEIKLETSDQHTAFAPLAVIGYCFTQSGLLNPLWLELLEFQPKSYKTDVSQALKFLSGTQKKKAIVFIISDFMSDEYEHTLKIASKKHDITGIRVYDIREEKMPNLGMVSMLDAETGQTQLINTGSKSVRLNYEKYYQDKVRYFKETFSKSGSGVVNTRVDESYVTKLLGYFKSR